MPFTMQATFTSVMYCENLRWRPRLSGRSPFIRLYRDSRMKDRPHYQCHECIRKKQIIIWFNAKENILFIKQCLSKISINNDK